MKETRGRRVSFANPESSLLLLKSTARMPHGGGSKIDREGPRYELIRRWIREGAPFSSTADQPVVKIEIEPAELTMPLMPLVVGTV